MEGLEVVFHSSALYARELQDVVDEFGERGAVVLYVLYELAACRCIGFAVGKGVTGIGDDREGCSYLAVQALQEGVFLLCLIGGVECVGKGTLQFVFGCYVLYVAQDAAIVSDDVSATLIGGLAIYGFFGIEGVTPGRCHRLRVMGQFLWALDVVVLCPTKGETVEVTHVVEQGDGLAHVVDAEKQEGKYECEDDVEHSLLIHNAGCRMQNAEFRMHIIFRDVVMSMFCSLPLGGSWRGLYRQREAEPEAGAFAKFAFYADGTALLLYDSAADIEPKAGAIGFFAYFEKTVKEMMSIFF